MYGLFHRAIREMVTQRLSPAAWQTIEQKLGLGAADFITARVYPDEQTIDLFSACADAFSIEINDFFEQFGIYWVGFAMTGPYRGVMQTTGNNLPEFIANLDRMHGTVRAAMPDARTPLFDVLDVQDDTLVVRYRSTREGLTPLVKGLLIGLLDHFRLSGSILPMASPEGDQLFHIQLTGRH